jgi:hypothetical protein
VNENAFDSIRRNDELDSINTDERDVQSSKQEELIISTVRGMMMDTRGESENASILIARTKCSAPIWTINRRRRTRRADEIFPTIGSPPILSHLSLRISREEAVFAVIFCHISSDGDFFLRLFRSFPFTNCRFLLSPNFMIDLRSFLTFEYLYLALPEEPPSRFHWKSRSLHRFVRLMAPS